MPLNPNAGIGENIKEFHTGKTYAKTAAAHGKKTADRQAIAVAFATQRRGHANGGLVRGYDIGGGVTDPVNAVISALQQGGGSPTGGLASPNANPLSNPATPGSTGTPSPPSSMGVAAPTPPIMPATPPLPTMPGVAQQNIPTGVSSMAPAAQSGVVAQNAPQQSAPVGVQPAGAPSVTPPLAKPLMNTGGALHRAEGGFSMQKSPHLSAGWQERSEAKNMMHSGPVMSAVPGRVDNHSVHVASSSYVLPSTHVAALGQGNTNAGFAALNHMFSANGPYGAPAMKMGHGPGSPKPPHAMKFADGGWYSEGGGRGDGVGQPTPVMISGGEYVLTPDQVRQVGRGSISEGHRVLDSWVMHTRKREIKTQQNLPPPAKD
jgi:hypothetical protein